MSGWQDVHIRKIRKREVVIGVMAEVRDIGVRNENGGKVKRLCLLIGVSSLINLGGVS
jgi:hypothetical protein